VRCWPKFPSVPKRTARRLPDRLTGVKDRGFTLSCPRRPRAALLRVAQRFPEGNPLDGSVQANERFCRAAALPQDASSGYKTALARAPDRGGLAVLRTALAAHRTVSRRAHQGGLRGSGE